MESKKNILAIQIPEGFELLPKHFQLFILQLIEQNNNLIAQNNSLKEQVVTLQATIVKLEAKTVELEAEIVELKARLNKNSSNSSKPPSSDGFTKPNPKSLREKTGKKTGGQPGHPGKTLEPVENPDVVEIHELNQCDKCRHDLSDVEPSGYTIKQEVDIPPVKPIITEHRMVRKICPSCKTEKVAHSPAYLTQSIQYGSTVQSTAAYLHYAQYIPLKRMRELFADLFSLNISQGSFVNMFRRIAKNLDAPIQKIEQSLLDSDVLHFDESSAFINGDIHWFHTVSNKKFVRVFIHKKRGSEAIDALNILPRFNKIAVHDHWMPYFKYEAIHALCNAHHLRELKAIYENYGLQWANKMSTLLIEMNKAVYAAAVQNAFSLPEIVLQEFLDRYDTILSDGLKEIPELKKSSGSRGRKKQHPAKNLYDRLKEKKDATLLFMHDFRAPFTNNEAERSIRMAKLKGKISGSFRSQELAQGFCAIRSLIGTSRKMGICIFQALEDAVHCQPAAFIESS